MCDIRPDEVNSAGLPGRAVRLQVETRTESCVQAATVVTCHKDLGLLAPVVGVAIEIQGTVGRGGQDAPDPVKQRADAPLVPLVPGCL